MYGISPPSLYRTDVQLLHLVKFRNSNLEEDMAIEYVRVFKSLNLTEINALYTCDIHQFEALPFCRQMLLLS